MESARKLVVIDGNAVMHRAYHALPPLTSPDGTIVNAVYGFLMMLFKVVSDLNPTHLAVCFDVGKPTFRQKEHPEYWANRPKADAEFISQMGVIHEVLEKMGIPIFEAEGYEGDDAIGPIVKKAETEGFENVVVTGDRDLLQLANAKTKLYMPIKGLTEATLFDEEKVFEKYGVRPSQWVDYKALRGDASDNYSGVVGIGPRTAEELIKTYGTLERIYKNIKKLPEKIALKLNDGEKMAELSKHLAQIVTDVPIEIDLNKTRIMPFDREEVTSEFEKWGFRTLVKRAKEGKKSTLDFIREERGKAKEKKRKEEERSSDQMDLF
jgi:DNA polymerase-1